MKNRSLLYDKFGRTQNTHTINFQNNGALFIFPYSIIDGCVNVTERGILSNGTAIDKASFVESVFTGESAIKVCWDNSTMLSPYTENPNLLQYDFKIGNFLLAKPINGSVSTSTEISSFASEDDFIAMKSNQSITVQFEFPTTQDHPNGYSIDEWQELLDKHQLFVRRADKRKFYKIPQVGEEEWFYLADATPIFHDQTGEIIGFTCVFDTVVDKIQNSGKAIEQYIQNNAPGEPYASPKLTKRRGLQGQTIWELQLNEATSTWDSSRLIRYIQVEQQGTALSGGVNVVGRRLFYDTNKRKWVSHPWSWLVPSNFYQFNNNPLNKTSVPSSTYAFCPDVGLKMSITGEVLETWKKINDSLSTMHCAGRVYLGDANNWTEGDPGVGKHVSNPNALEYWNQNWYPFAGFNFAPTPFTKELDMKGCIYTADTLSYQYSDSFQNIFIKNSFYCLNNLILPVSNEIAKPYRISNLPLIGNMISAFIGDRTIFANKTGSYYEGIGMFIDRTFLNWMVGVMAWKSGQPVDGFLNALGGEQIPKGFGSTCFNTTWSYRLSNKIHQTQEGVERDILTEYLAQTKDENGNPILGEAHKDVACRLQNNFSVIGVDYGFVIDKVLNHSLFSGNIRITCYSVGIQPEYATTVISKTKWLENSYTNWTTELGLGTWPSDYVSNEYQPTWPEQPTFKGTDYPINLNVNKFSLQDKNNRYCIDTKPQYKPECNRVLLVQSSFYGGRTCPVTFVEQYTRVENTNLFQQNMGSTHNYQFAYGSDYTDRDDFISKVRYLNFNIDGSYIGLTAKDFGSDGYYKTKQFTGDEARVLGFELQEGVYEYEKEFVFGFFHNDKDNVSILGEVDNSDFGEDWAQQWSDSYIYYNFKFHMNPPWYDAKVPVENGYTQKLGLCKNYFTLKMRLILGEDISDGLQLSILEVKQNEGCLRHQDYVPDAEIYAPYEIGDDWGVTEFGRAVWCGWYIDWEAQLNKNLNIVGMIKVNR